MRASSDAQVTPLLTASVTPVDQRTVATSVTLSPSVKFGAPLMTTDSTTGPGPVGERGVDSEQARTKLALSAIANAATRFLEIGIGRPPVVRPNSRRPSGWR